MGAYYCVKCKSKTATTDISHTTSKNGRPMIRGKCESCGCKKCSFVKKSSSEGSEKVGGMISMV